VFIGLFHGESWSNLDAEVPIKVPFSRWYRVSLHCTTLQRSDETPGRRHHSCIWCRCVQAGGQVEGLVP
jgi:hypothetical protein